MSKKITLLGIDIAKNVYQLHGTNKRGDMLLTRRLRRNALLPFIAELEPCTIVMEACGASNYWARQFQSLGHKAKLIAPQHVKPFVKGNKTDKRDALAITEAAARPSMHFVPIKSAEQQDMQSLHRVRQLLIKQRTMLCNQIRQLLAEYGIYIAVGLGHLKKALVDIMVTPREELSDLMHTMVCDAQEQLQQLQERIDAYDKRIDVIAKTHPVCRELLAIPGVGPKTATIIVADLGDAKAYKNGRGYAANLGLVPKLRASGEKQRQLGISKKGDSYIRQLLIHGGRSVIARAKYKEDKRSRWLCQLQEKGGTNKAAVALANKNARAIWAIVANNTSYNPALMFADNTHQAH